MNLKTQEIYGIINRKEYARGPVALRLPPQRRGTPLSSSFWLLLQLISCVLVLRRESISGHMWHGFRTNLH